LLRPVCPDFSTPANLSFKQGVFLTAFKIAQVLPLLKKSGLDRSLPANYRPISNLNTVSKIVKRLVLARLMPHFLASGNFNPLQSAYRTGHSTETALLRILDSLYKSIDATHLTTLIGLTYRLLSIRSAAAFCSGGSRTSSVCLARGFAGCSRTSQTVATTISSVVTACRLFSARLVFHKAPS